MEEYRTAVNNEPTSQKPNRLHALAFLEIGVFEFFFVAVVLFLLFGTLNYFNIIPISDVFPKYLSWLPRQQTQTKNILLNQQDIVSSPTSALSLEKNAKDVLSKFFSDNLTASATPQLSSVKFTQGDTEKNSFNATWQTKDGTASALFNLSSSNPNEISYLYLEIPFITESEASPSALIAESKYSNFFFVIPQGSWGCQPIQDITYCENFWEEDEVKKGIQINGPVILPDNQIINTAFMCEFHKDSDNLYSHRSCLSDFAVTGIQESY